MRGGRAKAERGDEPTAGAANAAAKPARERILETATELFYREGIRAVGVDTIVARSGVAKMSLYRSFPSKDDLVVAFLEAADRRYWAWWERVMARAPGDPRGQLLALFRAIATRTREADYRGCPFVNTATEFPDIDHRGRAVALANKQQVRERLRRLAADAGARDPGLLADQLQVLMDGAYATGQMAPGPAEAVLTAAEALIAAQLG